MRPSVPTVLHALARERGAARAWMLRMSAPEARAFLEGCSAKLRWCAPLSEAPVTCADLRALGRDARGAGWALAVDATVCGVSGCACERLGAHASVTGLSADACLVAVSRDAARALPGLAELLEGLPSLEEHEATVLAKASRDRWHAASDEAQVVASYLRCHPRVAELRYPGLKQDSSFAVAARTLQGGFGPFVDYRLQGALAWSRIGCTGADPRETVLALERSLAVVE